MDIVKNFYAKMRDAFLSCPAFFKITLLGASLCAFVSLVISCALMISGDASVGKLLFPLSPILAFIAVREAHIIYTGNYYCFLGRVIKTGDMAETGGVFSKLLGFEDFISGMRAAVVYDIDRDDYYTVRMRRRWLFRDGTVARFITSPPEAPNRHGVEGISFVYYMELVPLVSRRLFPMYLKKEAEKRGWQVRFVSDTSASGVFRRRNHDNTRIEIWSDTAKGDFLLNDLYNTYREHGEAAYLFEFLQDSIA